jgi:hypothetical protein
MENTELLINMYFKIDDELDGYWQSFIVINTAVIGWLFAKEDKFNNFQKTICSIAYGIFVVLIYMAMDDDFIFFEAVVADLNKITQEDSFLQNLKDSELKKYLSKPFESNWGVKWKVGYIISALGILFFIISDVLTSRRGKRKDGN